MLAFEEACKNQCRQYRFNKSFKQSKCNEGTMQTTAQLMLNLLSHTCNCQ